MEIINAKAMDTYRLRGEVLDWQNPKSIDDELAQHFIALIGGSAVGVASSLVTTFPLCPEQRALRFYAVAVAPEQQGRKIGNTLIDKLTEHAMSSCCSVIWAKARLPALGFYVKQGFLVEDNPIYDANTGLINNFVHKYL